ncbi:MAG: VWA domain-containing protein [Polyangiaceae bacterium]
MKFTPPMLYAIVAAVLAGAGAFLYFTRETLARRHVLRALFILSLVPILYAVGVELRLYRETYVRLLRPLWTPLAPVAVGFIAARLAGEAGKRARLRGVLSDLFFGLTALALALAVVGAELGHKIDRLTVIFAVDRSRSIDLVEGADEIVARELANAENSMRDDDLVASVVFGAGATTEIAPHKRKEPVPAQQALVIREGTDIEAAIRRALAEVPADSAARVVLITDGVGTRGDPMAGAAAALAAQVPVDAVVLEQREVPDLRVVAVRSPQRGDAGETVDLRVVTKAPKAMEVELRVKRDGQLIREGRVAVGAGEDVLRLREKLPDAGLHKYDVEVSTPDGSLDATGEDNGGSTFVRVRGKAAALVLDGDGKGAFIAEVLRKAEFRVDQAGGAAVPSDLAGFAEYDLVVFGDIAAGSLAPAQIEALAAYVRDFGGGLLLMGGDRSMGPGGYGKSPIEEISPVSFDLKQDERRGSLAEVIGIDISGSMGATVNGRTKLELANEAASRSAELLGKGDRLGVEHVDTEVHWTLPLQSVEDKAAIDKAIRSMPVGGGGIIVPITCDAAYEALGSENVNLKHVLLFVDGDDAEETIPAKPTVATAKEHGITTSVIALGDGHDVKDLEELASLGGGRFYLIEDATRLPAVFAQETILASRSALIEEPFSAQPGTPGAPTSGIDFGTAPQLKGYVVTIPKPRAAVHLLASEGDPLLATWSVGMGRAGAFTSDLKDRWGVDWTTWAGAARMLAQTSRDLARKWEDERVRLEAEATGGQLRVRATAVGDDGRAHSFRRLTVKVAGPGGFSKELPLEASGAGLYTAALPLDRPGTYMVMARDDVSGEPVGTTGAVLSTGEELRPTGSDRATLERISSFTGGKLRTSLTKLFDERAKPRFAYDDVSRWLVIGAAALLLLAVAARKLGIPEAWLDWARARGRSASPAHARAQPQPADGMIGALRRAKLPESPAGPDVPSPAAPRTRVTGVHQIAARPAGSAAPRPAPTAGSPQAGATRPGGPRPPSAPRPPQPPAASGPSSTRHLSAAELLLAKRKGTKR